MPVSSLNGVRVSVGLFHDQNRFQWTGAYLTDNPIQAGDDIGGDFDDWIANIIYPAWKNLACGDQGIVGLQVEPLLSDTACLPFRRNYPVTTFQGDADGDSTPSQTSVLLTYYSDEQITAGGITRTGKLFLGPAPEDTLDSGVIPAGAYLNGVTSLAGLFLTFLGTVTNKTWTRALGPVTPFPGNPPAQAMYYANNYGQVRTTLFTQRRRIRPLI